MGEAKTRAERRREAREAQQPESPADKTYVMVRFLVPKRIAQQIAARHNFVKEHFPVRSDFDRAIYVAGVEVFDQDINAFAAHARGESKPVVPQPEPERLVVPASEVNPNTVKTLAKMHEASLMGGRG
jgi:hypothetical protein